MSGLNPPTGNDFVDEFFEELDARILGARNTPPDSSVRLAHMRPLLEVAARADPWRFGAEVRQLLDNLEENQ